MQCSLISRYEATRSIESDRGQSSVSVREFCIYKALATQHHALIRCLTMAPTSTKQVECKYWRSGCCKKGDDCAFSHSHDAVPDNTCRYFLRGQCAFGERCRYNHVRPHGGIRQYQNAQAQQKRSSSLVAAPATQPQQPVSTSGAYAAAAVQDSLFGVGLPHEQADAQNSLSRALEHHTSNGAADSGGRNAANPFVPEGQSNEWLQKKQVENERINRSYGLECGICLEEVLRKERLSDRRFGVMSHCEHIFCWQCMKGWRYAHGQMGGATSATAEQARRCPECQQLSHFIVPCSFFPQGNEERQEVFDERRKQLARIPCKHFDFGRGSCPFGTSCFYAHILPDGTREDGSLRRAGDAEGNVRVLQPVRLSSFLEATKQNAP